MLLRALYLSLDFARLVVSGLIAQYNDITATPSLDIRSVRIKRLTVRGFIITDHSDRLDDFLRDVSAWLREGRIKHREHIVDRLEHAPEALLGSCKGAISASVAP